MIVFVVIVTVVFGIGIAAFISKAAEHWRLICEIHGRIGRLSSRVAQLERNETNEKPEPQPGTLVVRKDAAGKVTDLFFVGEDGAQYAIDPQDCYPANISFPGTSESQAGRPVRVAFGPCEEQSENNP